MTQAIQRGVTKFDAAIPVEFYEVEPIERGDARFELIKRTIGNGANDEEMDLFTDLCNTFKLNPFAVGQIYLVPRQVKVPARQGQPERWETRYTTQIGIGGLRLLAERTGKLQGVIGPEWCAKPKDPDADPVWRNVWLYDDPPFAARVAICHRNYTQPRWAVVRWSEFSQWKRGYNGKPDELTQMWKQYPSYMLGKAAEAAALRGAFPAEMAGVPTVALEADERPHGRTRIIEDVINDFAPPPQKPALAAAALYPSDPDEGEVSEAEPVAAQRSQQPHPTNLPSQPPDPDDMDPEQFFYHTARELGYRTPRMVKDAFRQWYGEELAGPGGLAELKGWNKCTYLLRVNTPSTDEHRLEHADVSEGEIDAAIAQADAEDGLIDPEMLPFETGSEQAELMPVAAAIPLASKQRGAH